MLLISFFVYLIILGKQSACHRSDRRILLGFYVYPVKGAEAPGWILKLKVGQPVLWVNFLELAALESIFLIVGYGAVKNSLASNAMVANARIHGGII